MDTYDFLADPRALSLAERRAAAASMHTAQGRWLRRLQPLIEPPALDADFPAFLLATPPFAQLARQLDGARQRAQLPAVVADELDWFVQVFRDYLRTCDGEDVFAHAGRPQG